MRWRQGSQSCIVDQEGTSQEADSTDNGMSGNAKVAFNLLCHPLIYSAVTMVHKKTSAFNQHARKEKTCHTQDGRPRSPPLTPPSYVYVVPSNDVPIDKTAPIPRSQHNHKEIPKSSPTPRAHAICLLQSCASSSPSLIYTSPTPRPKC